jgi:hypothetical protein
MAVAAFCAMPDPKIKNKLAFIEERGILMGPLFVNYRT